MNERVKKLWVEALRSGEYKQTRYRLKQNEVDGSTSHCCLGVLCEVHDKETGAKKQSFDSMEGFPPSHISEWADVNFQAIRFKVEGYSMHSSIPFLNDGRGYNFHQIADLIEAQL
jgi:hypothetical protein